MKTGCNCVQFSLWILCSSKCELMILTNRDFMSSSRMCVLCALQLLYIYIYMIPIPSPTREVKRMLIEILIKVYVVFCCLMYMSCLLLLEDPYTDANAHIHLFQEENI